MYRCLDCTLHFRAPAPSEEELARYYGSLESDDWWQHGTERQVWHDIKQMLERAPERSVLDVGCFRGDLLDYLGNDWRRFGVEPSTDARRVAEARGIEIVGERIESLEFSGRQFGAITLVDVIEHLPRPLDALRKLLRFLMPGGQLVIFTGSTDAWSWRFSGLHYWYSAMPEHVAFFRPAWFEWAAPRLSCRMSSVRRLPYEPASTGVRLDEALKNIAYVTYQGLSAQPLLGKIVPRLPFMRRIGNWRNCWWTTARDHILVALTKQSGPPRGGD